MGNSAFRGVGLRRRRSDTAAAITYSVRPSLRVLGGGRDPGEYRERRHRLPGRQRGVLVRSRGRLRPARRGGRRPLLRRLKIYDWLRSRGFPRRPPVRRLRRAWPARAQLAALEGPGGRDPRGPPPFRRTGGACQQAERGRARPHRGDLRHARVREPPAQPDRPSAGRPRHLDRVGVQLLQGLARAWTESSARARATGDPAQAAHQLRGEGSVPVSISTEPGPRIGVEKGPLFRGGTTRLTRRSFPAGAGVSGAFLSGYAPWRVRSSDSWRVPWRIGPQGQSRGG